MGAVIEWQATNLRLVRQNGRTAPPVSNSSDLDRSSKNGESTIRQLSLLALTIVLKSLGKYTPIESPFQSRHLHSMLNCTGLLR